MIKTQKLDAKKLLGNVPNEYIFRCNDGHIFKNMTELRDGLKVMSEETFSFHANAKKNDFSNWVRDIITDNKLARDLLKNTSRADAYKSVAVRVKSLSARIKPIY